MAILVKNQTVKELQVFLQSLDIGYFSAEKVVQAEELYQALLEDEVEVIQEEMRIDDEEFPQKTKGGAYII